MFSLISLLSLSALGAASYWYTSRALIAETVAYTKRIMEEANVHLETELVQAKAMLLTAAVSDRTVAGLKTGDRGGYSQALAVQRGFDSVFQDFLKFNRSIRDFVVADADGRPIYSTGRGVRRSFSYRDQLWFPSFGPGQSGVRLIAVQPASPSDSEYVQPPDSHAEAIAAVVPVREPSLPGSAPLGYVVGHIRYDVVRSVLDRFTRENDGEIRLVDGEGRNVLGEPAVSRAGQPDESGYLIVKAPLRGTDWTAVAMVPRSKALEWLRAFRLFFAGTVATVLLLITFVAVWMSQRLSKPIIRLERRMDKIGDGQFHLKLRDDSFREIRLLTGRIDRMIERIRELDRNVLDAEMRAKDLAIQSLQAQINPHFVFNTLQAVKGLSLYGRQEDVGHVIMRLSRMMRYSAYDPDGPATLTDELEHVRGYMDIYECRYPNRFRLEIGEEALRWGNVPMLKMTLQPIVENAVHHGLEPWGGGTVTIGLTRAGAEVRIVVTDNGQGVDAKRADELNRMLRGGAESGARDTGLHGIGLCNVHERIRLRFGPSYGVTVRLAAGGGFMTEISLPGGGFADECADRGR